MSLPLVTFISGISGVFIVMTFLLIMITLSSKLAIYLDQKKQADSQSTEQK